jgi:hypothetical protein
MLAMPANNQAQNVATRLALLGGNLIEPLNVFIGQISEDASHSDMLISYHDITSRLCTKFSPHVWRDDYATTIMTFSHFRNSQIYSNPN